MNNLFTDSEGWFNYETFYNFISKRQFRTLVEIGVWKGASISYLAYNNPNSKIYAVDLFNDTYRYKKGKLKEAAQSILSFYNDQLIKTNTRHIITDIKEYSWNGAKHFEDNSIDFIFIDADHSYEAVVKDLEAWFPKIKKNGIFSGHDYEPYGNHNHPGVQQAVDEFCKKYSFELKTFEGSVWYIEI